MLQLNIESSSYMCLDIDPDSFIHDILNKKITYLIYYGDTQLSNDLTMLPSFHISLGAPSDTNPKWFKETETRANYWLDRLCFLDAVPIIGDITLAPIVISEKDNKKSAWIPLNPHWFEELNTGLGYYFKNYEGFDHRCDELPVQHLHVSVANLTGNPQDSIARPEDCIIDTITN